MDYDLLDDMIDALPYPIAVLLARVGVKEALDDPEIIDALHDFETLLRAPHLEESGQ